MSESHALQEDELLKGIAEVLYVRNMGTTEHRSVETWQGMIQASRETLFPEHVQPMLDRIEEELLR